MSGTLQSSSVPLGIVICSQGPSDPSSDFFPSASTATSLLLGVSLRKVSFALFIKDVSFMTVAANFATPGFVSTSENRVLLAWWVRRIEAV